MKKKQPHPVDMLVGMRLRMFRNERGVSQSALANVLGLTFQQVQKYERGTNRISASKLFEISRFLGIRVADFYVDEQGNDLGSADDIGASIPSKVDIEIARALSRVADQRMKRKILHLIDSLSSVPSKESV